MDVYNDVVKVGQEDTKISNKARIRCDHIRAGSVASIRGKL